MGAGRLLRFDAAAGRETRAVASIARSGKEAIVASSAKTEAGNEQTLVDLLVDIDLEEGAGGLYDRVCELICDRSPFRRAAFVAWSSGHQTVLPAGSFGVDKDLLNRIEGTLEETPIAQRAYEQGAIAIHSGSLFGQIPRRYAEIAPEVTFACIPVQAGGEWIGVIFADSPDLDMKLTAEESQAIETLARISALAFLVERGASQRERARRLSERIALTRDVHERVIQRLFATSLALGVEGGLDATERDRCEREVRLAIADLRSALARREGRPRQSPETLRGLLDRLQRSDDVLDVQWELSVRLSPQLEDTARAVVAEAVANARKHANPSRIAVRIGTEGDAFYAEIGNDGGVPSGGGGTGIGLRLLCFEALECNGVVEFGPAGDDGWHVRFVAPLHGEPLR